MGIPVLVLGASGSGKSASLRNFLPDEVGVFNIASKPLPFRNKLHCFNGADYGKIIGSLRKNGFKKYVIDDSQYLMAFELLARAKEVGYQKYTDIGVQISTLIQVINNDTSPDTIVYFMHHTETNENTGQIKAKTIGKMVDNWLTLEGLFGIVLFCWTDGKKHIFITQSDGFTTAKSPMEMFPTEIDNDLAMVDRTIREYYGFADVAAATKAKTEAKKNAKN